MSQQQNEHNTVMSKARIGVEWVFGDITHQQNFRFQKNLKIGLSLIGKMYIVCALLMNFQTCLYRSMSSSYFSIDPPTIYLLCFVWLTYYLFNQLINAKMYNLI